MKHFHFVGRRILPVLMAALAGLSIAAGTAQAGLANATFGYTFTPDAPSFVGATLGSATSVTIPSTDTLFVNVLPATYLGNPNDFKSGANAVPNLSTVTQSTLTFNVTNINGGFQAVNLPNFLEWSTASTTNRYSFSMTSIEWTSSSAGDLHFLALGTFKDANGVFSNNAADISGSFTQAAAGGSVNGSFTFETPPEPGRIPTPEPGSLIVMLGMLGGFGAFMRGRILS